MKKIITVILLSTLLGASCKKTSTPDPADQLPPATQTGANTFGCLVNDKVWIPKGYLGTGSPNPNIKMEIGLNGRPTLTIDTKQISNTTVEGTIFLSIGNLDHLGDYNYSTDLNFLFGWSKYFGQCGTPVFDSTVQKWGKVKIVKLDNQSNIVSGSFILKFKRPNCDTIFLNDGRFDIKY